jgi:hypothetical protein
MRKALFFFALAGATALPLGVPATARATDIQEYNFNNSDGGWYSDLDDWAWSKQTANEGSWKFFSTGSSAATAYLYSPCFTVTDPQGTLTFNLNNGHKFNFGLPAPPLDPNYLGGAGQVQYSLDDGLSWQAVPLWSTQGGDVAPTFDPALMTSPTPLLTDGFAFQGQSSGPNFISSAFTLAAGLGNDVQFRFLGNIRDPALVPSGIAWDVEEIQIKGVVECVPEPGSIALAGSGALCGSVLLLRRRWARHLSAAVPG